MNSYRKIYNWLQDSYDFAVLDNNRKDWFAWRDEVANLTETNEQIWNALRIMFQIWTPTSLAVTVDSFTYGVPDVIAAQELVEPVSLEASHQAIETVAQRANQVFAKKQEANPEIPWGISIVGPTLEGWVRLVIPSGASDEGNWIIIDEDGMVAREYELRDAPAVNGLNTKWLRLKDTSLSSDLSLFVYGVGEVELRLTLGLVVFNPSNDVRPSNTLVRGVPLAQWQEANGAFLKRVFEELRRAGWEPDRIR